MYYQLSAADQHSMKTAYWEAEMAGMDPTWLGGNTFEIGRAHV